MVNVVERVKEVFDFQGLLEGFEVLGVEDKLLDLEQQIFLDVVVAPVVQFEVEDQLVEPEDL